MVVIEELKSPGTPATGSPPPHLEEEEEEEEVMEQQGEAEDQEDPSTPPPSSSLRRRGGGPEEEQQDQQGQEDDLKEERKPKKKTKGPSLASALMRSRWLILSFVTVLSLFVLVQKRKKWIVRQWGQDGGHLASKFMVVLFFLYTFSCIQWGWTIVETVEAWMDKAGGKWKRMKRKWKALWVSTRIVAIPASITIGSMFWNVIWKRLVCKSYHDRSCLKSWVGTFLFELRKTQCHDERTSYAMCDKLLAFLPVIILSIGVVLMANIIQPILIIYAQRKREPRSYQYRPTSGSGSGGTGDTTEGEVVVTSAGGINEEDLGTGKNNPGGDMHQEGRRRMREQPQDDFANVQEEQGETGDDHASIATTATS